MDLINRQDAIDAMDYCLDDQYFGLVAALKAIPSAQQWIPCSERLPEVDEDVLISYHFFGESEFFPPHYGVRITSWTGVTNHGIPDFYDMGDKAQVLAWMPLPKPWKGEQE